MDALRQALGVEQISYFGFSYGSELGGVWTTLFPSTVRAAVFDGASDPAAGPVESSRQQGRGFEAALDTFLARCSADSSCAFHNGGDAEGAFERLMAELDENPLPTTDGRVPANRSVAVIALAQSMYSDRYWPAFERALADAAAGDGRGLLGLHDLYYERQADGSYSDLIEAEKGILFQNSLGEVIGEEAIDIVPTEPVGHLGEVVGTEAHEVGVGGEVAGAQRSSRGLDHGAHADVFDARVLDLLQNAGTRERQLFLDRNERHHDLDDGVASRLPARADRVQ
jgi:hypothetical protein